MREGETGKKGTPQGRHHKWEAFQSHPPSVRVLTLNAAGAYVCTMCVCVCVYLLCLSMGMDASMGPSATSLRSHTLVLKVSRCTYIDLLHTSFYQSLIYIIYVYAIEIYIYISSFSDVAFPKSVSQVIATFFFLIFFSLSFSLSQHTNCYKCVLVIVSLGAVLHAS